MTNKGELWSVLWRYVVERKWLCNGLFGRKYCQELGLAIYECDVGITLDEQKKWCSVMFQVDTI